MGERILVVGCGGLGCELLKLLALDPANRITVVDDDTIDPTNLNRQFLFTAADVDQSKSTTAAGRLGRGGGPSVQPLFCRIDRYRRIGFYSAFDVVYNCLDNNETRSFVNQRCHLAGVPMVDGGSAGWLGQSFHNGKECFDCLPKKRDRIFPVCSIRQRPRSFEHCLVWARAVVEGEITPENGAPWNATDSVLLDAISTADQGLEGEDMASAKRRKIDDETAPEGDAVDARLHKIHKLAASRASEFGIQALSLIDSQTFMERIVPSVCTTNSIVASLMVISRERRRSYFLVQSSSRFVAMSLNERSPDCLTCSLPVYLCRFSGAPTSGDVLTKFGAATMITDSGYTGDSAPLCDLDGCFAVVIKNELKYRFYFESTGECDTGLELVRVK